MNETLQIDFNLEKQLSSTDLSNIGPYFTFVLLVMFLIFILICLGTVIELTQIGNRKDVLVLADTNIVNSLNYKDVNRKLLFEKEVWTYPILSFSFIRNNLHMLCKKRQKSFQIKNPTRKAEKLISNLAVLDGIRSLLSF